MTPQDLLKPRYKVIADFPNNIFKVGDILEKIERTSIGKLPENSFGKLIDETTGYGWVIEPTKYPAIFKKLYWYQEREEKDLEEIKYLKLQNGKVIEPYSINPEINYFYFDRDDWFNNDGFTLSTTIPLTKEEYESALKKK